MSDGREMIAFEISQETFHTGSLNKNQGCFTNIHRTTTTGISATMSEGCDFKKNQDSIGRFYTFFLSKCVEHRMAHCFIVSSNQKL